MPTIEDKLDELERLRGGMRATVEDIRYPAAKAAIIEIWNAAEKAMDATVDSTTIRHSDGDYQCRICGYRAARSIGHWDWCPRPQVEAALAKMEGNSHSHSHSRDEAMVEDKMYERDDIYKK